MNGTQKQLASPEAIVEMAAYAGAPVGWSPSEEAPVSIYMAYWQARSGFFTGQSGEGVRDKLLRC